MTGPVLRVRHAGLTDLGSLIPLFQAYLTARGRPASEPDAGAFLAAHLDAGTSMILLAEHDGRGIGFVQLYPSWDSLSLRSRWLLADVHVDADARRSGVGTALVSAALDVARESGAGSLAVETDPADDAVRSLLSGLGSDVHERAVHTFVLDGRA